MAPGLLRTHSVENFSLRSISSGRSSPRHNSDTPKNEFITPIAVVGFSLKFPEEATSPEGFWNMLMEKRCASMEIPKNRINIDAFYGEDKSRTDTVTARGGHFLQEDLSLFDAPFFSITSAEAASMDAQQRQVLECAYRALENAGMPMDKVNGSRTSVHTGSFADDFRIMTMRDPENFPKHSATGASISILANRLSWFFNLQGPSVHLDSACSSSMMALDMACQGLRNGDSNMALVAGSNTAWALEPYLMLANMNMLSPHSRCYSFDERANGYARGEGFGVLVLKRFVDAVRDGDTIRAVIRSTGCNSDGRTPGITQPSPEAQEALIKETYAKAGLDLGSTRFFEAHGTGTAVGDPIEAAAIGAAFSKYRSPDDPLYVGAVKSNIGHLEGASGVAGVIKTILALEKGVIPPNTNFERMNPRIDAPGLNLRFPTQALPWPSTGLRRASINSFGFGGSNAHVIIDDAYNFLKLHGITGYHNTIPYPPQSEQLSLESRKLSLQPLKQSDHTEETIRFNLEQERPTLLVWSSADEKGIKRLADVYKSHFESMALLPEDQIEYLSDLAYTLAERRTTLPWKSFAVANSTAQLQNSGVSLSKAVRSTSRTGLGFIFTGQGAQFAGMGRELLIYPVFKRTLQRADLYFQELGCSWSVLDELLKDKSVSNVNNPEYSQSLCTALQIALVELHKSFNITPSVVVGHSSGEIAAAYCMGAISFRSACKIAYYRGKLSAQLVHKSAKKGSMIAVGLSEAEVKPYIQQVAANSNAVGIVVACVNSPKSVTVSGDDDQVDALKVLLDEDSVFARKLQIDVAYHSPHMQQIASEYKQALSQLERGDALPGCKTMLSSVTSTNTSTKDLCTADYWVRNLTSPVRFTDAISKVASGGSSSRKKLGASNVESVTVYDFLELGPHSALAGPTKDILKTVKRGSEITYSSCLTRNVSALETTLSAAGRLWCLGYDVQVSALNNSEPTKFTNNKNLTDLPAYPFDHSQSYWQESRMSKEFRLRKQPRLDLLGTPSIDWNSLDARWRKFIRITETPWVQDHVVNGSMIYPAAGMLVMAIEGVRQLAVSDETRAVKGYRIKEATFSRALTIPSTAEGAESQLSMRPMQNSFDKETSKFEFTISTVSDGDWAENCWGIIQIEYESKLNEIDAGSEESYHVQRQRKTFEDRKRNCSYQVDSADVYDHFAKIGLNFGPSFQTLSNVSYNEGEVVADIKAFEWETVDGMNHPQPHLIHPTTLDALIQLILVGLTKGAQEMIPAVVPTRVTNLWLSSAGLCKSEAKHLRGTSKHLSQGYRQDESSFMAVDADNVVRAYVELLESTKVDRQHAETDDESAQRGLCYNMDWNPDLDLMSPDQTKAYMTADTKSDSHTEVAHKDIVAFTQATLSKLVATIDESKVLAENKAHLEWMRTQAANHPTDSTFELGNLAERINSSSQGRFYVEVGRHLKAMLYGEIDPFEVLVHSDCAAEYKSQSQARLSDPLSKILDLMAHKNPELKVLEIDGHDGKITRGVLETLFLHGKNEEGTPRCSHYDFTDLTAASLQNAQAILQQYSSRMGFVEFDIEGDVSSQDLSVGSYDVLIAAHGLHTTKDIDHTLSNARALLKPGGKLVLLERTGNAALCGWAFGLLPNWWQTSDKFRFNNPIMTPDMWHEALSTSGFTGVDYLHNDCETGDSQEYSMIISTARDVSTNTQIAKTTMIITADSDPSGASTDVAGRLQTAVDSISISGCEVLTLQEAAEKQDISDKYVISLLELESPLLHNMKQQDFESLKSVAASSSDLLWVTAGGGRAPAPEYQTAEGFLRSLRTENAMLRAVTLALDANNKDNHVTTIINVMQNTLLRESDNLETEYKEDAGMLMTPRVIEANYMNEHIHNSAKEQETLNQPFGSSGLPPLALHFETPGLLDSLRFIEDEVASKPLGPNEVEIEVRATGVNFMDCLTALGRINQTEIGGECAGVITRTSGSSDLKVGDRVCGIVFDCFKSLARCDAQCVVKIPDGLSFTEAAALPMTCTTAYQALMVVGRLQKGESILIHAAAGGTGQVAIQLAQHAGAEVFATVSSQEKKQLIMDLYGLRSDHILYSRDTSFAMGIKRMTNGRGVDVVLNSLAGEGLNSSWACMASFGRFVEIGKRDIHSHSRLDMYYFAKNVSFSAVDVFGMYRERPDLVRRALSESLALVAEEKVHCSKPMQAYPVSQVEDAFRYMQSGKNVGKIVVDMGKDDVVRTVLNRKPAFSFDADATYMVAGGFGGLARRTARWMASRGAKNLLLLGRSGAKSEAAQALVKELDAQGVLLEAPPCDISDARALKSVLTSVSEKMPPIKGCIQGAMVLQDVTYDRMTYDEWHKSTAPKIAGTRNLHELLPSGMDFFIILSSISGIYGSIGQANYAAGGTYQDALAKHRVSKGEKAIVLDLGWMASDGVIAENESLRKAFETSGIMMPIYAEEYLSLLDYYCNPALELASPLANQMIVGLKTPAALAADSADVPDLLNRPMFRYVHGIGIEGASNSDEAQAKTASYGASFSGAASLQEAVDVVVDGLANKLSKALSIPSTDIEMSRPLHSYGVDSLLAVELRSWFAKEFKSDVAVFEIMGARSFPAVASIVASKSQLKKTTWEQGA